nr:MAG: replication associated protein [Cressdnaviricota sp.]
MRPCSVNARTLACILRKLRKAGNINPALRRMEVEESPPPSKKDYECKKWFCTINNPTYEGEELLRRLVALGATKVCVSLEKAPTTGTPHFQGAWEFPTKKRRSALIKALGPGSYDKQKTAHAYEYCSKEETHIAGPWIHGVPLPRTIPTGLEGHEPYSWQKTLFETVSSACTDTRTIHWFWSSEGSTGKSAAVNELTDKYGGVWIRMDAYHQMVAAIAASIAPDMVGAKTTQVDMLVAVIDCPRDCRIDYSIFEGLKDGRLWNSKYRPGALRFPPCHVVVFSNQEPIVDEATLSSDRLKIICVDK